MVKLISLFVLFVILDFFYNIDLKELYFFTVYIRDIWILPFDIISFLDLTYMAGIKMIGYIFRDLNESVVIIRNLDNANS